MGIDQHIPVGTRVRLDSLRNDDGEPIPEFGVVIDCWFDEEMGVFDCEIAFYGDELPDGTPTRKPYVLRYAAISLTVLPA